MPSQLHIHSHLCLSVIKLEKNTELWLCSAAFFPEGKSAAAAAFLKHCSRSVDLCPLKVQHTTIVNFFFDVSVFIWRKVRVKMI